jgi:hypothetical protein
LTKLKLPSGWETPVQISAKKTPVVADGAVTMPGRINMSAEIAGKGLCPDCNQAMSKAIANEHEVYECAPCRIAIPTPD